jgi:HK97 gp10 family phage protein
MKSGLIGTGDALATLSALSKQTAKAVGRRSLIPAAQILVAEVTFNAPVLSGALAASVRIDTKISRMKQRKGAVDLAVIADDPAAVPTEYGTSDTPIQSFFRRAIASVKAAMFEAVASALQSETVAAAKRVAKRATPR